MKKKHTTISPFYDLDRLRDLLSDLFSADLERERPLELLLSDREPLLLLLALRRLYDLERLRFFDFERDLECLIENGKTS